MKHTPGPWTINDMPLPSSKFIRIGNDICHVPQKGKGKYYSIKQVDKEASANAHLIAAAPDLLEACQLVYENLKPAYPSEHLCIKKLSKAIAKAEGK